MDSFEARGYAVIPGVLSNAECDHLKQALKAGTSGRAGSRHLMLNPAVLALANDDKLTTLARRTLSTSTAIPFRATLFNKTSKANWLIPWHQDTALPLTSHSDDPEWTSWSQKGGIWHAHAPEWALKQVVALRIHLDPSTSDNGPLRAIPGSHLSSVGRTSR